jgi:hypothetical protein
MTSAILLVQPSWVVANGEAMYETFLFVALVCGLILVSGLNDKKIPTLFGFFCLGISVVIHPRVLLPVILIAIFVYSRQKTLLKTKFSHFCSFLFFPAVFLVRNFVAERKFTLYDGFTGTISSYNPVFETCSEVRCIPRTVTTNFEAFIHQGFQNISNFFSPYWGPNAKGTWFHNISLLLFTDHHGSKSTVIFLGQVLTFAGIILALLGSYINLRSNNALGVLFFAITSSVLATDFVVYGDNRHRLMVSFCLIPLQLSGFQEILHFLRKKFTKPIPVSR